MGKVAFSGPVYGAKETLFSFVLAGNRTSGGGDGLAGTVHAAIIPVGEDWYITGTDLYVGSTGDTAYTIQVVDDSTRVNAASTAVVSSCSKGSSLAGSVNSTIVTADAGEYEGKRIASGSTVLIREALVSSGRSTTSDVSVCITGYRRFVSSTRSE